MGAITRAFANLITSSGITGTASVGTSNITDYETGTWSPTLLTSGTAPTGVSYSIYNNGWYIKIGKLVMLNYALVLSSKGTGGTGAARIGGFPFASTTLTSSINASAHSFQSGKNEPMFTYGTWNGGFQTFRYANGTNGGEILWSDIANSFSASGQCVYTI